MFILICNKLKKMSRNVHVYIIIVLLIIIAIYLRDAKQPRQSVAHNSPFKMNMNWPNVTVQTNIHITATISAPHKIFIEKIEGEQVIVGEKNIAHQTNRESGEV